MRLLRECDVLTDFKINGKTLVGIRGDGSQITVPLNLDVPAIDLASHSQAGLMSATDKMKLDSINDQFVGVSYISEVSTGAKIGTLVVGDKQTPIYAPVIASHTVETVPAATSEKTSVTYTPTVTSGTKLGELSVDGRVSNIFAPAAPSVPEVTYVAEVTSGTKLGALKVGTTLVDIFAPAAAPQQTLSKAAITNALGFTPISTEIVPDAMAPGDNYTEISTAGATVYAEGYRTLQYSPPSNGYCTITGKKAVRISDFTNGLDSNSFSSSTDVNYGAAVILPVRKGHDIRFVWHVDSESVTSGLDRFRLRFIPAT